MWGVFKAYAFFAFGAFSLLQGLLGLPLNQFVIKENYIILCRMNYLKDVGSNSVVQNSI